MPADALNYMIVSKELGSKLNGGHIDKITMPEKDAVVISVRVSGQTQNLLLSASPSCPRCHLTSHRFENPSTAPAFLMHLRKHIGSGNIISIKALPYERIILITIEAKNDLGYLENKTLIIEIMGKYSNIILVNNNGLISDSIKHISLDTSSKRQVLPGLAYVTAPPQNKFNISCDEQLTELMTAFNGGRIDNYILSGLSGLAPSTINEAVYVALGTNNCDKLTEDLIVKVSDSLKNLYDEKNIKPCMNLSGVKKDFFIFPYESVSDEWKFFESINEAMDEFYFNLDQSLRVSDKTHNLSTVIKNGINRMEKKLDGFLQKQKECGDYEFDKLYGELLTANIYKLKTGFKSITLDNYYFAPPVPVTIELDCAKSPQQNAQSFFKKYSKKKRTLQMLDIQIEEAKQSLEYFESINASLRLAVTKSDFEQLGQELIQSGIIKNKKSVKKSKPSMKPTAVICHKFTYLGYNIFVGKNNIQNDALTKKAKANDIWLHTKIIPGSHVIIESQGVTPPDEVIKVAAELAAFYSKAYLSTNVPVDYTLKKFVSKPIGAPPGKVIYTNQMTVYVNPKSL